MQRYIAFLRGVNISGKNKISMPMLKQALEDNGFSNITTYINSGNVIFDSPYYDKKDIGNRFSLIIKKQFNLDIPVAVISVCELSDAINNAPPWWDFSSDKEMINKIIFLIYPVTAEQVKEAVGKPKEEYEQVYCYKDLFFWSAPRDTLSKTRWYKIASSSVNNQVTIRNSSTVKKLLSMT